MKRIETIVALGLAAVPLLVGVAPAFAAELAASTPLHPGEVIVVAGTPQLWVADQSDTVHWVADLHALAGKPVDWSNRTQVTLDQLQTLTRGDPWLSEPLVKIADDIFLPKWDNGAAVPTLLRIQSPSDLDLIGITAENYGSLVLDQPAWEQRSGLQVATLQSGDLGPIVAPLAAAQTKLGAANPTAGAQLARIPSIGVTADVTFDLPTQKGWHEANNTPGLNAQLPLDTLTGEQIVRTWRVLNGPYNGAYVYVVATALPLDQHSDVKTAADLANKKLALYCHYSDSCSSSALTADTIGGNASESSDSTNTRIFVHDPTVDNPVTINGIAAVTDPDQTVDQLQWSAHHVFVVHGNWGYEFRITSIDSNLLNSRLGDFNNALSNIKFGY